MPAPGEQLLIKLWETAFENGLGGLLRPWQIRREGRALNDVRREEMLMLAQTEADIKEIHAGRKSFGRDGVLIASAESTETVLDNILGPQQVPEFIHATKVAWNGCMANALRSEINSSKALLYAEERLSSDSQVPSPEKVDEDWFNTWRDYAGRVSAEKMQRLWGSVLAGEIKSPGQYSLRTLEFLKTLSRPEAELIATLACYVIDGIIVSLERQYLHDVGLSEERLLELQSLGVIVGVDSAGLNKAYSANVDGKFLLLLKSNNKVLIVKHADPNKSLSLAAIPVTSMGLQIIDLGKFEADVPYLKLVGKGIVRKGFAVELGEWTVEEGTTLVASNLEQIKA